MSHRVRNSLVRKVVALGLLAVSTGAIPAWAAAPAFPERPLRYIVPFPPGGSTDIVARIIADRFTAALGQQVVIDNRGGAAGTLGAALAAQSPPDGHTVFACNIASLAVSPARYKKLSYDPVRDFEPIGLIGSTPNALAVHPSVQAKSVAEFISLVKSRPGKLDYASPGIGTSPQLSMEMLKLAAGIDLVHIPYKGGGPAIADVIGGHVQAMFGTVASLLPHIRSSRLRVLAVTSKTRHPDLPDIPTIESAGMRDFEVISWQGMCTPAGVPKATLAKIRSTLNAVLAQPATLKTLTDQGMTPTPLDHVKFAGFIRTERDKWAKVVKAVGIPQQ